MPEERSKLQQGIAETQGNKPEIADDNFAEGLRGFGPSGIIAILFILFTGNIVLNNMLVLPVSAILVLLWIHLSHTPWKEIGYVWPRKWFVIMVGGLILGIALKILLKVIIMPLLGAASVNQTYHFLTGNKDLLPMAIVAMLVAGFAEETVFRGFYFERLGKLFGSGRLAKASIVILTTMIFALGHYSDQGVYGAAQAAMTGLTFGTIYATTGSLLFVMLAHTGYDLLALVMIYNGTESDFAHFIF